MSLRAGDKDKEIVAQTICSNNSSMSPNARECTLVTNGDNELTTYIDRQKVFSSTGMDLNMPASFEYYIETQTNSNAPSTGGMFLGITDYYHTTTGLSIDVINVPANSVVRVVITPLRAILLHRPRLTLEESLFLTLEDTLYACRRRRDGV